VGWTASGWGFNPLSLTLLTDMAASSFL
jgi:hypothetical protein